MGDEAMNQPEPVADAGGVVERLRKLADECERGAPKITKTKRFDGPALLAADLRTLLAQVESLKAERDDLQAEAGTQALTIRRLTQEREAAARDPDILADAVALTWARCGFDPLPSTALGMIGRHLSECAREVAVAALQATAGQGGEHG